MAKEGLQAPPIPEAPQVPQQPAPHMPPLYWPHFKPKFSEHQKKMQKHIYWTEIKIHLDSNNQR